MQGKQVKRWKASSESRVPKAIAAQKVELQNAWAESITQKVELHNASAKRRATESDA